MSSKEFVNQMKVKASEKLLEVSVTGNMGKNVWEFNNGLGEVITIRGGAIEKAAIMHLKLFETSKPSEPDEIVHEVFQMEVFPEHPSCPMGHFNAELYVKEPRLYYLNLDLFPAVRIKADLDSMKKSMDKVAERFGLGKRKIRQGLDEHYTMNHFSRPLASKVGCKLPQLKERDFELFVTAYETFFAKYIDIINKRKNGDYTERALQLKLVRNGKWVQYLSLKDRAFRGAPESGIPSDMLIEMGFPPSAAF